VTTTFDRDRLRQHALGFSKEEFLNRFRAVLEDSLNENAARRTPSQPPAVRENQQ